MHVIAAKAIALREAAEPAFQEYAQNVVRNAATLAGELAAHGLRIVSGGTDNHLLLVDVSGVGLTGAEAEQALGAVHVTCNKNLIPYDSQPPMKASGVRLGTAAITSRGLGQGEVKRLAGWISETLRAPTDEGLRTRVRAAVHELVEAFPIRSSRGARQAALRGS
jgi:glycine hydroxymethyltransferase